LVGFCRSAQQEIRAAELRLGSSSERTKGIELLVFLVEVALSGLGLGVLVLALGMPALGLAAHETYPQETPRIEPRALADLRVSASQ
jgi:hypothetical protein